MNDWQGAIEQNRQGEEGKTEGSEYVRLKVGKQRFAVVAENLCKRRLPGGREALAVHCVNCHEFSQSVFLLMSYPVRTAVVFCPCSLGAMMWSIQRYNKSEWGGRL